MRKFTADEKRIIEEIVTSKNNHDIAKLSLGDIITHEMEKVHCDIVDWREDGIIKFCYNNPATQNDVMLHFMDIMVLFEYLDREGLVHIFEIEDHSGQKAIFSSKKYKYNEATGEYKLLLNDCINLPKGKLFIKEACSLSNNFVSLFLNFKQLLERYSHAIIYPTPVLVKYVENGYKTDEDIKFKKQCKLTKISIYTAWVISVANIVYDIFMR